MKNLFKTKGFYISTSTALIIVVIIVIIANSKKNKRLETECEKRNGTWDKKTKKCNFSQTGDNSQPNGSTNTNGSQTNQNSGNTGTQWSPNQLASTIYNKIEGWNWLVYPEVSQQILALTDAQLRILYHYYNDNYAEEYPTLTQLFANEWNQSSGDYDDVVLRLKGLNLN